MQPGDTVVGDRRPLRPAHRRRARDQRARLVVDHLSRARCCGSPRHPLTRAPPAATPPAAPTTGSYVVQRRRHDQRDRRPPRPVDPRACSPRTASAGRRSSTPGRASRSPAAPSAPAARGAPRLAAAPAGARRGGRCRTSSQTGDTISAIAAAPRRPGAGRARCERPRPRRRSSTPGRRIAIPVPASVVARGEHDVRRPDALHRARRRADRERAAHHQRRPRARRARPRHRDRARHGDAGVLAAQPRLGRPRLARSLPAAPERGVGHAGARSAIRCAPRGPSTAAPSDPNGSLTRGLLDIAGWQAMSFAEAAQAVQISAYPDAVRAVGAARVRVARRPRLSPRSAPDAVVGAAGRGEPLRGLAGTRP